MAAGVAAATSTSARAGEFGGAPEIDHLLSAIGAGQEAIAGLGALDIGGAVGGEELIERRRVRGTVGAAQFAAVLVVTKHRGDGRQQGAFLCDGGRSVADLAIAGLLEFREIGQRGGRRAQAERHRAECDAGRIGANQGDAFGSLQPYQGLGLAIGIGERRSGGKLRTAGRFEGDRGAHHRVARGIAQSDAQSERQQSTGRAGLIVTLHDRKRHAIIVESANW